MFGRRKRNVSLRIDDSKCEGCEKCVQRCRRKVLGILPLYNGTRYIIIRDAGACVGCGHCREVCGSGAIEIKVN